MRGLSETAELLNNNKIIIIIIIIIISKTHNVYGAVITAEPLREFTQFI